MAPDHQEVGMALLLGPPYIPEGSHKEPWVSTVLERAYSGLNVVSESATESVASNSMSRVSLFVSQVALPGQLVGASLVPNSASVAASNALLFTLPGMR